MSGAQTSTFPSQNILYDMATGATGMSLQQKQNELMQQQQDISAHDIAMTGQAAAPLLGMSDEDAAREYPGIIQSLQGMGYAKRAPATYPGHAATQALVQRAMPILQQYQAGFITPPGLADALKAAQAPLPGYSGVGTGAAAAPASGGGTNAPAGGTGDNNFGNIRPVGAASGFNTYETPQDGIAAMSSNLAAYANQHGIKTLNGLTARWAPKGDGNNDPIAYAAALGKTLGLDPNAEINLADPLLQTHLIPAMAAIEKGRPFSQPPEVLTAGIQAGLSGKGGSAAPPAPPGGVAARVGGTDVAGPGATPSGPIAAPAATSAPGAAPAPQNALAPPPVAAQAAAPPGGTGVNSSQFQAALELNRRAQALELAAPASPQAKAMAASLRAQAALYMQADAVSVDPNTGIQTKQITGERLNAAAPNAHYVWNDQQGAYVDTTGTHPPVTPPSPRLTPTKGGEILQSKPGGGATVVFTSSPQDVATQSAAQAQGTGVGGDVAKQMPALVAQGRNATQAIGNIDYGMNQLREAAKSGIPTGYFSQWLATGAAAAKSLGIDLSALGVDPKAVGNIQSAQKTLGVVAGAILQQAIGKDSQITDAKIEHFIHTQPGIETDPQAVERVLNWARSQFVYESEQSRAAVAEAANSPTGTLPLNWQARYFRDKGFAPIYDPGTGEMQQPEGRAPSREPPPQIEAAPINPSARTMDKIYQTKQGPMKWKGTGWLPVQ